MTSSYLEVEEPPLIRAPMMVPPTDCTHTRRKTVPPDGTHTDSSPTDGGPTDSTPTDGTPTDGTLTDPLPSVACSPAAGCPAPSVGPVQSCPHWDCSEAQVLFSNKFRIRNLLILEVF